MDKRAYSSAEADTLGFPRSLYTWNPIPEGEWVGTLDAKIWGEGKFLDMFCYFTAEGGAKLRLAAYRAKKGPGEGKWYTAQDCIFDMSSSDVQPGQKFALTTSKNSKGNPRWDSVRAI